jgi:hypothetical protein
MMAQLFTARQGACRLVARITSLNISSDQEDTDEPEGRYPR